MHVAQQSHKIVSLDLLINFLTLAIPFAQEFKLNAVSMVHVINQLDDFRSFLAVQEHFRSVLWVVRRQEELEAEEFIFAGLRDFDFQLASDLEDIYSRRLWAKLDLDKVADTCTILAKEMFDIVHQVLKLVPVVARVLASRDHLVDVLQRDLAHFRYV